MTEKTCLRFLNSRSGNRKSKSGPVDENLKWVALLAVAFVFAVGGAVVMAQQPTKILRMGIMDASSASITRV